MQLIKLTSRSRTTRRVRGADELKHEDSPFGPLRRQFLRGWIEELLEEEPEELERLARQGALLAIGKRIHPRDPTAAALLDDSEFRSRWRKLLKEEEALLLEELNRDGRKRLLPRRRAH